MSRPAVAAVCAAVLLTGFVAGRVTGHGSGGAVTVRETSTRSVVVLAQHVGSTRDPRDSGPLDLARVTSVRDGVELKTTITARHAWPDSVLRRGRVRLRVDYDTDGDGRADRRDVVFLFHGRPTSWISSLGQGVQAADVTRPTAASISIVRDVSVFYDRPGQAGGLMTSAIGVAVVARRPGGGDRVPDRGWITVPPPRA